MSHTFGALIATYKMCIYFKRDRAKTKKKKKINNLLSVIHFLFIQMKDMKLSSKEFLSSFFFFSSSSSYSLISLSLLSPESRVREKKWEMPIDFVLSFFLFSFSHMMIPPEWIASITSATAVFLFFSSHFFSFLFLLFRFLNQNKRIGHRCRQLCLISRRWLSMLWACHLIHKNSKCR